MATARGSTFKLRIKKQTNPETLATGNFTQVPCLSFGLTGAQALGRDDLLSANQGRDGSDPYLDTITVEGSAVVPQETVNYGHWLTMLLGAPTTTGTTDLTHVWKSGATTLPSYSIEKAFPEVPAFDMFLGVQANTLSLDLTPSGPANATIGLLGLNETTASTTGAGTATYAPGQRFMKPSATITKDGVALAKVVGGSVNFSNGMTGVRTIRSDNRMEEIDVGTATAGGDLRIRFADNTLKSQAIASTPCALVYGFQISATKSIEYSFPRVFLSRPGVTVDGPGGIEMPVSWQAAWDSTAAAMMTVTLKTTATGF